MFWRACAVSDGCEARADGNWREDRDLKAV